jgi:hypothetical protein
MKDGFVVANVPHCARSRDASYGSRRVQQVVERHPGVCHRACVFGVFGGSVEQ